MDKTSLGNRMKGYEATSKTKLLRRTPVIIRLDGKAFHTWTKHLKDIDESLKEDPFSNVMFHSMGLTSLRLMENIQNAVFAYTQSDEISILLNDWKRLTTDQWFDGGVQKIASVSASMATYYFDWAYNLLPNASEEAVPAFFDARVFNLPKEEVVNYFVWRQQDASRNSVNMLGQFHFSHKQLHGKSNSEVQDMLMLQKKVNWNDLDTWKKRGLCITPDPENDVDADIPIFTKDRDYIEQYLNTEESK